MHSGNPMIMTLQEANAPAPKHVDARVLVVDDDAILRLQLLHLLGKFVTEVRVAEDGAKGLAQWRDWRPDVTVTDILMPEMDGLEMSRAIKAEDAEAQIIVVTADTADVNLKRALQLGVQRYITKPVDVLLLTDAIDKCLRDRELGEELRLTRQVAELTSELKRQLTEKESAEAALQKEKAEQQVLIGRLEEAHNQLLQSEKLASLGQLAAGVAHEINNPMGFVSSNLGSLRIYAERLLALFDAYDAILASLPDNSPERLKTAQARKQADVEFLKEDLLSLIGESAAGIDRVRRIVNDLKTFSHIDSAEWQFVNLNDCIDSTLNLTAKEFANKAEVIKRYGNIPEIECLPSEINQVLLNLLLNAVQAVDQGGKVSVRTGSENGSVWLEVTDTGCGIPPENLKRIFDPFFTTKPVGTGTGLGLSITYGIVRKHNGHIDVQSEPGKGTTFRIVLPIRRHDAQPLPEAG
jgi:two-component system, NtrC family, sensor kinase